MFQSAQWGSLTPFNIPHQIFTPELILSPRALTAFLILCQRCRKADEDNSFSTEISTSKLMLLAGWHSPKVVSTALKELEEHKLIKVTKKSFQTSRYVMCRPQTGQPLMATPKGKSLYFAQAIGYFMLPSAFISSTETLPWSLSNLTGSEVAVYVALAHLANPSQNYTRSFPLTEVVKASGLDARTAPQAFEGLNEKGLVYFHSQSVELTDPRTGEPLSSTSELDPADLSNYRDDSGRSVNWNMPWTAQQTERMIEECIPANQIVEYVGESLRILCPHPEHHDTKASCSLTPSRRQYRCFGCAAVGLDEGGSFFKFIRMTGKSPEQAAQLIGQITGQRVTYREPTSIKGAEAVYSYRTLDGKPAKRKIKRDGAYLWQNFHSGRWQWGEGSQKLLYNLPEVQKADIVCVTEGEKDATSITSLSIRGAERRTCVVGTTAGGANDWRDEFANELVGKKIIVCPDADQAGARYRDQIVKSLKARDIEHVVLDFGPTGYKDVSDYLAEHPAEELRKMLGDWVWTEAFQKDGPIIEDV